MKIKLIWKEIVYHGFAQLGNEHSPTPRRFEAYPIFSLDFVGAEIVSLFDVNLRFKLTLCGTSKFSRYSVLGKIQIEEPGVGRHPRRQRNNLEMFLIHIRYLLLDTVTGYLRQQWFLHKLHRQHRRHRIQNRLWPLLRTSRVSGSCHRSGENELEWVFELLIDNQLIINYLCNVWQKILRAMVYLLSSEGRGMSAETLAWKINSRRLYARKVVLQWVWARFGRCFSSIRRCLCGIGSWLGWLFVVCAFYLRILQIIANFGKSFISTYGQESV